MKPTEAVGAVERQWDERIKTLGWLGYLSSYCSHHQKFPAGALARLFIPAVNNKCVRLFESETGAVCAALIWARLTDQVSERMIYEALPPTHEEWSEGNNLWFLDIIAPFDHGRIVARHLARNPPKGPFYFARLAKDGRVKKVVKGDAERRRGRVQAYFLDTLRQEPV